MIIERDFAIIGAGPAGMAAAAEAAAHGATVTLIDENHRLGGKVLQDSGLAIITFTQIQVRRKLLIGCFYLLNASERKSTYIWEQLFGVSQRKKQSPCSIRQLSTSSPVD